MPYCTKREFIFIHIPKTGGTSIEYKLDLGHIENGFIIEDKISFQHSDYTYYQNLFGYLFKKYTKFTVVRNPYTRIISAYFYIPNKKIGAKASQSFDDFLKYVESVLKKKNFHEDLYDIHFRNQHEFICDSNGKIKVDKLFHFEKYNEVEDFLFKKYNITDKRVMLKGNYKKNQIILTDKQKNLIYNLYKKDFELFGYSKDFVQ